MGSLRRCGLGGRRAGSISTVRVERQGEAEGGGEGDRASGSDSGNPFVMGGGCLSDSTLTTSSGDCSLCKVRDCVDPSSTRQDNTRLMPPTFLRA